MENSKILGFYDWFNSLEYANVPVGAVVAEAYAAYVTDTLQSENERLRKAMENIVKYCEDSGLKNCDTQNKIHMAVYMSLHEAKSALAQTPGQVGGSKSENK